jgi:hypothetical protein
LHEASPIDSNELEFSLYSPLDDFSNLDFTDRDALDPLDVNKFIHNNPQYYVENNISAIYLVRYEQNIVAYFTLSMSSIIKKAMENEDLVSNIPFTTYPALLLGQLGVEKKYQGRGLGQYICKFCRGIGQELNQRVACAFLILQTTVELAKSYYEPKCRFKWKHKDEGKTWMYFRLFTIKKRYIFENIPINTNLSLKVTKAEDIEKMKNNPSLCIICQKETEIVYNKDDVRLCKECLDNVRDRYG